MDNKNRLKLENIIKEEMGYTVVDWGETTDSKYRPSVINLKGNNNKNISILELDSGRILIKDFAIQMVDQIITDLDTIIKDGELSQQDNIQIQANNKKSQDKFKIAWKELDKSHTDCQKHPVATSKNLILKNAFVDGDTLCIPFTNIKTGEITGVQTRFGAKSKYSISGSILSEAVNIVQKGERVAFTGELVTYLSESYSTACEVAEAEPKARVVCTAGIAQVKKVYNKFLGAIVVMDKTKNNKENKGLADQEKWVTEKNIPFIQLCKTESRFSLMTDFNDYAIKYGKYKVQRLIHKLSAQYRDADPELISFFSRKSFYNITIGWPNA